MTTITSTIDPAVTITPELVTRYEANAPIRNRYLELVDDAEPDADLRPAGVRRGRIELLFTTAAAAHAAYAAFAGVDVWELDDPDVPEIGMRFTLDRGELTIRLDDLTRAVWLVGFPFLERVTA